MSQEIENVIIVSADSLREKELKNSKDTEFPFLQDVMNRPGDYYSNASWTVPAHASIFSGKLPSEHGTSTQNIYFEDNNRLTEYFSDKGFSNILLTENDLLTAGLGLSDGFDKSLRLVRENGKIWNDESWRTNTENFVERWTTFGKEIVKERDIESAKSFIAKIREKLLNKQIGEKFNPTYTDQTIEKILEHLDQDGKKFIFTNWMITHYDYTFTEKEREEYLTDISPKQIDKTTTDTEFHKLIDGEVMSDKDVEIVQKAYRASIKYLDRKLKELWGHLSDGTLLVVIGDHGEIVGEKKYNGTPIIEHHFGTFEALLEVPYRYKLKGDSTNNLEFDLASHKRMRETLKAIIEKKQFKSSTNVIAEYYGKSGIAEYFGEDYPEEFSEFYQKESFSMIEGEKKIDLGNNQICFWAKESYENVDVDGNLELEKIPTVLKYILKERGLL